MKLIIIDLNFITLDKFENSQKYFVSNQRTDSELQVALGTSQDAGCSSVLPLPPPTEP